MVYAFVFNSDIHLIFCVVWVRVEVCFSHRITSCFCTIYTMCCFTLAALKISVHFGFHQFGCAMSRVVFNPAWDSFSYLDYFLISFETFRASFCLVFCFVFVFKKFFLPFSLSSPFGTPVMYVLSLLILSWRSLRLFTVFHHLWIM